MIRLSKRHLVVKNFYSMLKEFLMKFCFIPFIVTLVAVFLMVYMNTYVWFIIPITFIGAVLGYGAILWFLFDFNVKQEFHGGDE